MTLDPSEFKKPKLGAGLFRNQVVLLVDVSGSMSHADEEGVARIDQLSTALEAFLKEDIRATGMMNDGELAIGLFNNRVKWLDLGPEPVLAGSPFYRMNALSPWKQELTADGSTKMADAIRTAVSVVDNRRQEIVALRMASRFKPQIFLITDGHPDKDQDMKAIVSMLASRSVYRESAEFLFFAIGVHAANMKLLAEMAPRASYHLDRGSLRELLTWVSDAIRESHTLGEHSSESEVAFAGKAIAPNNYSPEYENVRRRIPREYLSGYDVSD